MGRMAGRGGGRVAGDIGSAVIPAQKGRMAGGGRGRVAGDNGLFKVYKIWHR